ncbi:hypothetical protein ACFHWV_07420, partial [Micromonospora sp. LOL_028]
MTTIITRTLRTSLRNTALGIAGLTLAGGAVAAPALAAEHTPTALAAPVAAASSGVDTGTLTPHGVQGEQSR